MSDPRIQNAEKKLRKRRSADETCTEKGEGVWADPSDCTKYFICRSMSTNWAEKKHETCYSGSYFDPSGGQCKWVGQGNFNCDDISGKGSDSDTDKENPSTKSTKSDSEKTETKTKKKSSSELSVDNKQADTFIPAELYTCKAEPVVIESNADNIKCYSCEADSRNINKCKSAPSSDSIVINCASKKQKCFSKAVFSAKNELVSFSRGCASQSDLESSGLSGSASPLSSVLTTAVPNDPRGSSSSSSSSSNCVAKPNSTKACYEICDKNLCNTQSELKSLASKLAGTMNSIVYIVIVLIASSLL